MSTVALTTYQDTLLGSPHDDQTTRDTDKVSCYAHYSLEIS